MEYVLNMASVLEQEDIYLPAVVVLILFVI